ncbi:hypothetical protein ACP6C7_29500 [Mycolicibacterium septicum]
MPIPTDECWAVVVDQDLPQGRDLGPEAKEGNDFDLGDECEALQSDAAI